MKNLWIKIKRWYYQKLYDIKQRRKLRKLQKKDPFIYK